MAKVNPCPGCGNPIPTTQKKCEYCRTLNPYYKRSVGMVLSDAKEKMAKTTEERKINWWLAVIFLIVFFPLGIVYIVYKFNSNFGKRSFFKVALVLFIIGVLIGVGLIIGSIKTYDYDYTNYALPIIGLIFFFGSIAGIIVSAVKIKKLGKEAKK